MPTNKELDIEVQKLKERLGSLQSSSSRTRDELAELKAHCGNLVAGLNERFEKLHENFLNRQ